MITRRIAEKLLELTHSFPVITIEGPRQSGKTTLTRMTFPDYAYANLEEYATRTLAERDPRGFLLRFPAPAVIDEIQRVPQLLNEIQAAVDANGGNGQYVLTGSHQPRLSQQTQEQFEAALVRDVDELSDIVLHVGAVIALIGVNGILNPVVNRREEPFEDKAVTLHPNAGVSQFRN